MDGLDNIPCGRPIVVACDDYDGFFYWCEAQLAEPDSALLLEISYPSETLLNRQINSCLKQIAELAYALWPSWQPLPAHNKLFSVDKDLSILWHHKVASLCNLNQLPILKDMATASQIGYLCKAIARNGLVITLRYEFSQPSSDDLFLLAKFAQWLAKESHSKVLLLVPSEIESSPSLDSILYDKRHWKHSASPPDVETCETTFLKPHRRVHPIIGKPHPFSPGEQILAELLERDTELAGLFLYNQPVNTVQGSHYIVDLLWSAGKLVLEIDGFTHHSSQFAFQNDRQRDYELLLSGYHTCRFPHNEVVESTAQCVEKIRQLVAFFKEKQLIEQEI